MDQSKRKAFTEFHNSTMYGGKDSTSPYLGDDTSVRRQQVFSAVYGRSGVDKEEEGRRRRGEESGLAYALRRNNNPAVTNNPNIIIPHHNTSPSTTSPSSSAPLKTVKEGKDLDTSNSSHTTTALLSSSFCNTNNRTITSSIEHNAVVVPSATASTSTSTIQSLEKIRCILDSLQTDEEEDEHDWWTTSSPTTTTTTTTTTTDDGGVEGGGGDRYKLIGPAVLSACPTHVSSFLYLSSSSSSSSNKDEISLIFLGKASVAQVNDLSSADVMSNDAAPSLPIENHDDVSGGYANNNSNGGAFLGWYDSSFFILWRNYLLEYDISHYSLMKNNGKENKKQEEEEEEARKHVKPKGYAHLEKASIAPHPHYPDVLLLSFYNRHSRNGTISEGQHIINNNKNVDARTNLMFRVSTREERNKWISSLQHASNLSIDDLYEYDATEDGFEFGRGRYATVRPAVRKKMNALNYGNYSTMNGGGDCGGGGSAGGGDTTRSEPNNCSTLQPPQSTEHQKQQRRNYVHQSSSTICDYDCALKIIDKNEFWSRVKKGRERADTLVRETAVQATLTAYQNGIDISDHSRPKQEEEEKKSSLSTPITTFLRLYNFFETRDNIVLELELLGGTDLFRHVLSKGVLNEKEAARIMRDLLLSLDAMSKIGVAHRDVKPANILMVDDREDCQDGGGDDEDEHRVAVKLADFGMATFVGNDGLLRGRCGTPGYVAPEVLNAGVNSGYGNKVDVFSAGVTLYVMLCGYEPFYGESDAELIAANRAGKVDFPDSEWAQVSLEGRDLVERMLQLKPEKRIGAADALKHPWILRRAPPPASWKAGSINKFDSTSDCSIS